MFTHVQKQSAIINMKESNANDTTVLFTTKNNVNLINNAAFIHVQKQSAVINIKENDANDTAVLSTIKNNINSANNAARSDKFVKSVHLQRIDKSENFMNKIHTLLYFSISYFRSSEKVIYSMIFYSKSMILAEINYHIYDKKLLIIIQCFEH